MEKAKINKIAYPIFPIVIAKINKTKASIQGLAQAIIPVQKVFLKIFL